MDFFYGVDSFGQLLYPLLMRKIPFYVQILVAMLVGALVGEIFGLNAAPLGEFGKAIIQLIKTLAAPLLFFAILDAFLRTELQWKNAATMVGISAFNAFFAVVIGLGLSNLLRPGDYFRTAGGMASVADKTTSVVFPAAQKIDYAKALADFIPVSLLKPFVDNAVISIIVIAVLLGAALRKARRAHDADLGPTFLQIEKFVMAGLKTMEIMLTWVIKLVPIAVFGVVAKVVGEQGFSPIKGLASYFGIVILGLFLHVALVYQGWLVLFAKVSLKKFWGAGRDAVVYAMGASSSLATLPVTLKCLERMGVSPQSARLSACVGTNLNNDGILLYEALAVLFVAQAHGIHLGPGEQLVAAFACVVASLGITGVPEAGLISLSLALATVGLPVEILPLLLTVDWILGRVRAVTNVVSDMLGAVLLDRFAGRPVLQNGIAEQETGLTEKLI